MPHTSVERVRIRYYSPEWGVDVIRGVGFRGRCDDCWQGAIRKNRPHALDDVRRHRRDNHGAAV